MLLQKNIFLLVKNLKQMQRTINNLFKRDIAANRRLENSLIFKSLNLITNINFALVKNNGQLLQWFLVVESLSATYELHRCTSIILILFLLSVIPNIIYIVSIFNDDFEKRSHEKSKCDHQESRQLHIFRRFIQRSNSNSSINYMRRLHDTRKFLSLRNVLLSDIF